MDSNFIKINFEDAIRGKKNILNSELHIIYAREHIKHLIELKKQQIIIKNKIKDSITSIQTKIGSTLSHFPENNIKYKPKIKHMKIQENTNKISKVEEELMKIKSNLQQLQNLM